MIFLGFHKIKATEANHYQGSSNTNMYDNETVINNTMVHTDDTVIGGLSQSYIAGGPRTLYHTQKGESPV